jgi:hypothetical protein
MPFVLLIIGILLLVVVIQDTHKELGALLYGAFSGEQSFLWWILALAGVGSIGFIDDAGAKTFSKYLLFLILVVMIVRNYSDNDGKVTDFFSAAVDQIKDGLK